MAGVDYAGFEAADDTVIWRYMPSARFDNLLAGRLYFAAAHQFDDQFEGAITAAENARRRRSIAGVFPDDNAQIRSLEDLSGAFADLRRMTKLSCWHARRHENVAMWERYRTAGRGVAVASTVGALKRSLCEFRLRPNYGVEPIVVGAVRYIDYATEEMAGESSMLDVFMHKRVEYRDETEIRALLSLRMAAEHGVEIPADGVDVSIDARELMTEVRAHPEATPTEVEALADATRRANVDCPVSRSRLGYKPTY